MDTQNIHCKLMTFFAIVACVAMVSAVACAATSRFTGWSYMTFGIIAAIVTGVSFTFTAIELMEYQFDWREEEG